MQKAQYSDRVMKKIMSKQINTQTDLEQVQRNSRDLLVNIAHAGTDPDLVGRSIMTESSVNKMFRKDGSLIKTSYLH